MMDDLMRHYFPFVFPVFFVTLWLLTTMILGKVSGWYDLMSAYPDRAEAPLCELKGQSGYMRNGVHMRSILRISVCPSGLRIGLTRIFGPFCRDFFVPWADITIERKDRFFSRFAELQFGHPVLGKLGLFSHTADRLARSALEHWPEVGPFTEETSHAVFASVAKQWLAGTCLASLFFFIVLGCLPRGTDLPLVMPALLFPAFVFGVGALISYISRTKK